MPQLPPPPVPQKLREMLKDYPEHLQELQKALDSVVAKPLRGTPPFEVAIWSLEDALDAFYSQARDELKVAEASSAPASIEKAKAKKHLMARARSGGAGGGMLDLSELKAYLNAHKGAFE